MAKQLSYKPLNNIGVNGLNTQSNPTTLDSSWLTAAENIVLRESGRISFRKGFKQKVLATTLPIGSIGENEAGVVVAGVGTNMYTVDFTTPDVPWTNVYAVPSGTASDWKITPLRDELYCMQAAHEMMEFDTGTWLPISSTSGYNATAASLITVMNPSCGMAFYGRMWVGGCSEDKGTLLYSDTLNAHKWGSGAAGYIDLHTVWDSDEIVSVAPFYGKLVIFGRHNIVIYNGPTDPSTMVLDEVIRGVGCVSRDSVVAVGDDLMFMSDTGLRSLFRTTEKDKLPLTDLSLNIKDTIVRNIASDSNIKSVYIESEGVLVVTFVTLGITYVFDIKHKTPNDAPRITTWSFSGERSPTSLFYSATQGFLVGQEAGSIATYEGYYDKTYVSGGTYTSIPYNGKFKTIWIDLGNSVIASLLKKLKAVISGGPGTNVGLQWYKDFSVTPSLSLGFTLNPTSSGTSALWGASTSLFGAAKYAPIYGLREYNIPLSGSAKFLQLEMSAETAGYTASLQDLTLLYKEGKIR